MFYLFSGHKLCSLHIHTMPIQFVLPRTNKHSRIKAHTKLCTHKKKYKENSAVRIIVGSGHPATSTAPLLCLQTVKKNDDDTRRRRFFGRVCLCSRPPERKQR